MISMLTLCCLSDLNRKHCVANSYANMFLCYLVRESEAKFSVARVIGSMTKRVLKQSMGTGRTKNCR